jgi:hypothetical protein
MQTTGVAKLISNTLSHGTMVAMFRFCFVRVETRLREARHRPTSSGAIMSQSDFCQCVTFCCHCVTFYEKQNDKLRKGTRMGELTEVRYDDNYLTVPNDSSLMYDATLPPCRSNQWNRSPAPIVGLVTNSFVWKRNRRGLTGRLYAEAVAPRSLDAKGISSSNTSSSAARERKQEDMAVGSRA